MVKKQTNILPFLQVHSINTIRLQTQVFGLVIAIKEKKKNMAASKSEETVCPTNWMW